MDLAQEFAQSPSELKPEAKRLTPNHQLQLFSQDGPCGHPGSGGGEEWSQGPGDSQVTGCGRLLQKETRSEVTDHFPGLTLL